MIFLFLRNSVYYSGPNFRRHREVTTLSCCCRDFPKGIMYTQPLGGPRGYTITRVYIITRPFSSHRIFPSDSLLSVGSSSFCLSNMSLVTFMLANEEAPLNSQSIIVWELFFPSFSSFFLCSLLLWERSFCHSSNAPIVCAQAWLRSHRSCC